MRPDGPDTDELTTERLVLTPLRVEDAEDLAVVLGDERLHEFTGGRPATVAELRADYARLLAGPADADAEWLNWVVRRREDARPVGTVQATLRARDGRCTALVAWTIGVEWQGRGLASEAARALVSWARRRGADEVVAHVHPDHLASAKVASRAGLRPTEDLVDGERVWRA